MPEVGIPRAGYVDGGTNRNEGKEKNPSWWSSALGAQRPIVFVLFTGGTLGLRGQEWDRYSKFGAKPEGQIY